MHGTPVACSPWQFARLSRSFGPSSLRHAGSDWSRAWHTWPLVLVLAGGAWAHLIQKRFFTAFDPSSVENLCFGLGAAGRISAEQLWSMSRQMTTEGAVMVLAMMVPGAARAAVTFALSRNARSHRGTLGHWVDQSGWISGYLVVWLAAVGAAVAALALTRLTVGSQGAVWAGLTQWAPLTLAAAACVAQFRIAWAGPCVRTPPVPRSASESARRGRAIVPGDVRATTAVVAGIREGLQCVRRCALLMLALHAIAGSHLGVMAAYASMAWWLGDGRTRWLHALIGAGLATAAIWRL